MKRIGVALLLAFTGIAGVVAAELPQTQPPLVREAAKATIAEERRMTFGRSMDDLSPETQEKFWKIYADYEPEKKAMDETRLRLLDQYVSNVRTMTDDQMADLVAEAISNQDREIKLRKKYFKRIRKEVSGTMAGRFYEVDDFLAALLKVRTLSKLPVFRAPIPSSNKETSHDQ